MNAESLAVAVIVLAFALRAAFQLLPTTSRRLLAGLRAVLGLKARPAAEIDSGCGSGCGTCNSCGSAAIPGKTPSAAEAPIEFQRTGKG